MAANTEAKDCNLSISFEFVEALRKDYSPLEIGTLMIDVFNDFCGERVDISKYDREFKSLFLALSASSNRIRKTSEARSRAAKIRHNGGNVAPHDVTEDPSNAERSADSDAECNAECPNLPNLPNLPNQTKPSAQSDRKTESEDRLAKRDRLFPIGGDK